MKKINAFVTKFFKFLQVSTFSRKYYRNEFYLNQLFQKYSITGDSSSLDVGSGPKPKNPFNSKDLTGVDFRENKETNVHFADLSLGNLPFQNDQFDFVTAFDLLEHIPRTLNINGDSSFPFILLMNEVFRVLKPGGVFFAYQPVFPAKSAFQDPTHVNIMSEDTLDFYFCEKAWARIYGFTGSFELVADGWIGEKYFCFMRKADIEPILDLHFVQKA